MARWIKRIASRLDRMFIDRQILVRSEGSVKYIDITRGFQMFMASVLCVAALLSIWSVSTILVQDSHLHTLKRTIDSTNLAYSSVVEEMTAAQRRFVQLATQIQSEQSHVIALLEERSTTREAINKLDLEEQSVTESGQSKADLLRRLEEIEAELVIAYNQDTNMMRLSSLQQLAQHNDTQSIKALSSLDDTLEENPNLLATDTVRRYLRAAEIRLRSAVEERDTAVAEGEKLSNKYIMSERRIAALKAAQQEFIDQLAQRTDAQIASLENTISITGLMPNTLVQRYSKVHRGQGGPTDTLRTAALSAIDGLTLDIGTESQIASLERRLDKWTVLHEIMRTLPLSSPVDYYYVSSRFGKRRDPFTKKMAMHAGIDLAAALKTDILASAPGVITFAGRKGAYGRMIEIDHGIGLKTRYGHLHTVLVKKGDQVSHRDKIGLMGSTGRSTGSHLHYEVIFDGKKIDPAHFIRAGRMLLRG